MSRRKSVSFSLPIDFINRLSKEAEKRGLSRSSFLTLILSEYFSKKEKREGNKNVYKVGRFKKKT